MSNPDWEIQPEIGQIISQVSQEHPIEAREAVNDIATLKNFFNKYGAFDALVLLENSPHLQDIIKRLVLEVANR